MATSPDYERGLKEGRIDALLEAHTTHLARINGSIERAADASLAAAESTRVLAGEIRTMAEQQRLAAERVKVAADTLATETERRRKELADSAETGDRRWGRRERLAALALTVAVALATLYVRHLTHS